VKRTATKEEKEHMACVAALGCIVCSHCLRKPGTPAQVHHVRVRYGWGRSGHEATIPLCREHHTGRTGVHGMGRDEFTAFWGVSELELLEIVVRHLEKQA
jgi:hypothetical protein